MWIPNNRFMEPGEDSTEKAITYLDAVVGDDADAPGTSHEKRLAYVVEGAQDGRFPGRAGRRAGARLALLARLLRRAARRLQDQPHGHRRCRSTRTNWATGRRSCARASLEVPVRLDDGMKLPFMKHELGDQAGLFAKIAARGRAGQADRQALGHRGRGAAGPDAPGGARRQASTSASKPPVKRTDRRRRQGDRRRHREGRQALARSAPGSACWSTPAASRRTRRCATSTCPARSAEWSMTHEGDTGDMHLEMERIGGVTRADGRDGRLPDDPRAGLGEGLRRSPACRAITAKPHAILVDQSGRALHERGRLLRGLLRDACSSATDAPAVPSWAIIDQQVHRQVRAGQRRSGQGKPAGWLEMRLSQEGRHDRGTGGKLIERRSGDAQGHGRSLERVRRQGRRRGLPPRRARL